MASPSDDERWLMMAVLDHLQKATARGGMNAEPLQEAIFAISNAYTLNMHSSTTKQRYPLDGLSLPEVYKAGRAALLGAAGANGEPAKETATAAAVSQQQTQPDQTTATPARGSDAGFERFLQRLRSSTTFFKGVEESSPEFALRLTHARRKYDERLEAKKKQRLEKPSETTTTEQPEAVSEARSLPQAQPAAPPPPPAADESKQSVVTSEADKAQAKVIKERGNAQLKAKQYDAALQSYTQCIELDSENAVYYSNRAAANIKLSRFTDAVDDCKKAISLDPEFARPRERLASAYRHLGMTKKETECLRDAVQAHPGNDAFAHALGDAETRLRAEEGGSMTGGNGGAAGGAGGGPQLDANMIDMMSKSMGFNMPEGFAQTLANSDVLNQMGNMVRDNPAMVENIMRMMGSGSGGEANANGGGANKGS